MQYFLDLIFLEPKKKWQENGFTENGLDLATTFKSDWIMLFWDPMSKIKSKTVLAVDRI